MCYGDNLLYFDSNIWGLDDVRMDKILELVKYVIMFIAVLNALVVYIFTNFKKGTEKRLDALEALVNKDHDKINMLVTLERERK